MMRNATAWMVLGLFAVSMQFGGGALAFAQDSGAQSPDSSREAAASRSTRPEDMEPGVDTSATPPSAMEKAVDTSTPPPPSVLQSSVEASATDGESAAPPPKEPASGAKKPRTGARSGNAVDRLELDTTQITGNRELPKVLYIVPWKRSDLGDLLGKPVNSLLDEVLTPVDRDVFKRENRYFTALEQGSEANGASGANAAPAK